MSRSTLSGRLKAIATTGRERMSLLPDVPTVAESGLAGYEAEGWFGVFAPAKTPPEVITILADNISAVADDPKFKERIATFGGRVLKMNGPDFVRYIAAETKKRSDLIKANNIVLE